MEKLALGLSLYSLLYLFLFYLLLYWNNQRWDNGGQAIAWSSIKKKTRAALSKLLYLRLKKRSEKTYEEHIVNN